MENLKPNHLKVYVTVILIIMANLKCCCTRSVFSIENKDFYGIFNNFQKEIVIRDEQMANNNSYKIHSYSANDQPIVVLEPIVVETTSLWPLETITRKHFEIINMLWRKTKIFLDGNDFTTIHTQTLSRNHNNLTTKLFKISENKDPIVVFSNKPSSFRTTTPSNIEFYYLNDENTQHKENKCSFGSKCMNKDIKFQKVDNQKTSNSSFHVFRIRGPALKVINEAKSGPTKQSSDVFLDKSARYSYNTFLAANTPPTSYGKNAVRKKLQKNIEVPVTYSTTDKVQIYFSQSCPESRDKRQDSSTEKSYKNDKALGFYTKTTLYDKIKFFEMYDRMTPITALKWKLPKSEYDGDIHEESQHKTTSQNEQRILLINVDQSGHEHNQSKHFKKHIREDQLSNLFSTEIPKTKDRLWKNEIVKFKKEIKGNTTKESKTETNKFEVVYNYFNKTVEWSEYPFAAVYIYEPSQIHCDAAAISPHWLIASGACLSRLNKNPYGERRSAFVAYCGVEWWRPERISYVKYSLVHPSFHPTEKTRKYLYNIGLVQVVTSMMSACSGWSPVTLMSHQFATAQEGTIASALGWGLDRFDMRYASGNLPRSPLTLYNALLFLGSCPGNSAFRKGKTFDRDAVNKNVYCLALPPYFGEDSDPVHGGLLLVGSHLIALYLQEERRSWGEQSAQYTGIWRLIPWITEVAKETEDIETSFIEI